MIRTTIAAGGLALLTLTSSLPASAHDANQIAATLWSRGYYKIRFIDPFPPRIQVNACRGGVRFHFHVNYYGDVTQRRPIGLCDGYYAYRSDYRPYPYYRDYRRYTSYREAYPYLRSSRNY